MQRLTSSNFNPRRWPGIVFAVLKSSPQLHNRVGTAFRADLGDGMGGNSCAHSDLTGYHSSALNARAEKGIVNSSGAVENPQMKPLNS
ncbi:Hypothetical predicted protein [Podarcis lilfordi]|uniref:Uncharacterized protein n=1 Tax=Podarcis lilfordi TaxID=74358 RepID=A0AA35P6C6_9SAUR|nr:Hypothetical predicted protein [Podarcis lilfordi]